MRSKCICIKTYLNDNGTKAFCKHLEYEYTTNTFSSREHPEGFSVQFSKGEYIYFRKYQDPLAPDGYGLFSTYFKTLKDVRKEKLKQIEQCG